MIGLEDKNEPRWKIIHIIITELKPHTLNQSLFLSTFE